MKAWRLWLRRGALVGSIGVVVGAVLAFDVISRGEREMEQSDQSFDRGDLVASLVHARRAAALYVPGAPHVKAAYARLIAIATGSESTGRLEMARRAWGAVRGSVLETQSSGERHYLESATNRLAVLYAPSKEGLMGSSGADQPGSLEAEPEQLGPRWFSAAALVIGLLATALGLAALARFGLDSEGQPRWREAGWALILLMVGVACWTLVVFRA